MATIGIDRAYADVSIVGVTAMLPTGYWVNHYDTDTITVTSDDSATVPVMDVVQSLNDAGVPAELVPDPPAYQ